MGDLDPAPTFVLDKNEHFSERMSGVWIGYELLKQNHLINSWYSSRQL